LRVSKRNRKSRKRTRDATSSPKSHSDDTERSDFQKRRGEKRPSDKSKGSISEAAGPIWIPEICEKKC